MSRGLPTCNSGLEKENLGYPTDLDECENEDGTEEDYLSSINGTTRTKDALQLVHIPGCPRLIEVSKLTMVSVDYECDDGEESGMLKRRELRKVGGRKNANCPGF